MPPNRIVDNVGRLIKNHVFPYETLSATLVEIIGILNKVE